MNYMVYLFFLPQPYKYLWNGQGQTLISIAQRFYLGVTWWKCLQDYYTDEFVEGLSHALLRIMWILFWRNMFWSISFKSMIVASILSVYKPQFICMCWIKYLNQTHYLLVSCSAKSSAWLDEVAVIICLMNLHDIHLPPLVNK